MGLLRQGALIAALLALALGLLSVPPACDVARSLWNAVNPVARQLRVAHALAGGVTLSALHVALERGVFEALHTRGPLSSDEIAWQARLPPNSARVLLDVLATTDWVRARSDGSLTTCLA
jgi:hypothetical protein